MPWSSLSLSQSLCGPPRTLHVPSASCFVNPSIARPFQLASAPYLTRRVLAFSPHKPKSNARQQRQRRARTSSRVTTTLVRCSNQRQRRRDRRSVRRRAGRAALEAAQPGVARRLDLGPRRALECRLPWGAGWRVSWPFGSELQHDDANRLRFEQVRSSPLF